MASNSESTSFPILVKEGRYWVAKIDTNEGWIETEYGVIGTPNPVKSKRKVVPKKKTMQEQCLQEIKQRYKEKRQDGYRDQVTEEDVPLPILPRTNYDDIEDGETLEEAIVDLDIDQESLPILTYLTPGQLRLPMLATPFEKRVDKKGGIVFPLWAQKKANGVRGIFVMTESGVQIYSRTLHSYHFMTALRLDVEKVLSHRPDVVFDGEIYAQGIAGQNITSIAAQKKTPHPDEDQVQLWLFDCYIPSQPGMVFSERRKLLERLIAEHKPEKVVLMPSVLVNSMEELGAIHEKNRKELWEGTMLRFDSPYEHRRSLKLIKYKFEYEMDTTILGIEATEGDDVVLRLEMDNGKKFVHRPEGTVADKQEWLADPAMVIGKIYSFSYTHLSEDGIPLSISKGMIRFDLDEER